MSQSDLFAPPAAEPAPRRVNLAFVRKTLLRTLWTARRAERQPWSDVQTKTWIERFPQLAALLPEEEGEAILGEFRDQLRRLGIDK
jgi:hypothetical protein